MFFNAHAFVASKIYNSSSHLLILGSILPDIAVTKIIPWENGLHKRGKAINFFKFVKKDFPELIDLCKGISAHIDLDNFSHNPYNDNKEGYAYQNNRQILKLVQNFYSLEELPANEKAHNYIESAVDILIVGRNPDIQTEIKRVINEIDIGFLARILGSFFKGDEVEFEKAIKAYFKFITSNDLGIIHGWINLWRELEKLLELPKTSDDQKKQILNLSISIVKPTYEEFLDLVIKKAEKI